MDFYTAVVYARPRGGCGMESKATEFSRLMDEPGGLVLFERNHHPETRILQPFESAVFHVPTSALLRKRAAAGSSLAGGDARGSRAGLKDPVIQGFACALLQMLCTPGPLDQALMDQLFQAAIEHLATTYGTEPLRPGLDAGRLTSAQLRQVKAMIDSNPDGAAGATDSADVCDISAGHFTHLFQITVGSAAPRRLLEQRLAYAKNLLRFTPLKLRDIATACGFYDQSHFDHVFSDRLKISPLAWRHQSPASPCFDVPRGG